MNGMIGDGSEINVGEFNVFGGFVMDVFVC